MTLSRRLPGVRVETAPQALDHTLPRMDIACFIGFAGRGPLDLPVAVESLADFESVFGGTLTLGRDVRSGEPVTAQLHACVRSFFAQGGRRCWVLRVAGEHARTSRFALPGLLRLQRPSGGAAWQAMPARIDAGSPGSAADTWRVSAQPSWQSLLLSPVQGGGASLLHLVSARAAATFVRAGDLLCLPLGPLKAYARIESIDDDAPGPGGRARIRLTVRPLSAWRRMEGGPLPVAVGLAGLDAQGREVVLHTFPAQGHWLPDARLALDLHPPAARWPRAGEVLALHLDDGGEPGWMALDEVDLVEAMAPDGHIGIHARGRPLREDAPALAAAWAAWRDAGGERRCEVVRLDLRVQGDAHGRQHELTGLAMTSGAAGSVFDLPDDARRHAQPPPGPTDKPARAGTPIAFPLCLPAGTGEHLLLPMQDTPLPGPGLPALPSPLPRLVRDGLDVHAWTLFAEPALAGEHADLLPDRAEALRLAGATPRPLRGVHALFGAAAPALVDEPTLLAVPDAVHPGWMHATLTQAPWTEMPASSEPPADAPTDFIRCDAAPLPAPRFVRGADPATDGSFTLYWTVPVTDESGLTYELQEAGDAAMRSAVTVFEGPDARRAIGAGSPGVRYYRVRARAGGRLSPWSAPVRVQTDGQEHLTREEPSHDLLAVHRLMLRVAAGRGDVLALLALPRHFDDAEAMAHAQALRSPRRTPDAAAADPPPISEDETRALSHGALYHPWLATPHDGAAQAQAPDGAVCGQFAAQALSRGAWRAVANLPLRDVVAAGASVRTHAQRQRLHDTQVNLLRSVPRGFVIDGADTLIADPAWRPVNVRRLMCLLRRLALRRGATYVFEPNDATLRRTVGRSFEAALDELYRRGALAGARPQAAYRVELGEAMNTPQRRDAGQFWVELKVAPALPLSFLTVRLQRQGERLVSTEFAS